MQALDQDDDGLLQHGKFVVVHATGWLGQILDFRMQGFNEPEYHLRIWTGTVLFKEWFSECELVPAPVIGGDVESQGDNVVDLTKFKGKLDKDTPTGGTA